jgi:glycyl-tRNA synthetase beta chain
VCRLSTNACAAICATQLHGERVAAVVDSPARLHRRLPEQLEAVRAFEGAAWRYHSAPTSASSTCRAARKGNAGAVHLQCLSTISGEALHAAFDQLRRSSCRVADSDYGRAAGAGLVKPTVDRFFDDVMVMADDPKIRGNRLALLREVAATMNHVADISKLVV